MTEQKKNSYHDEDMTKVLEEIEGFEDEKVSVRAEAAGKCSQITKRIANAKKVAKSLGIPTRSLNALLKVRKLERQIEAATEDVPEDEVELFEEMSGQFSWFKPEEGETPAKAAATNRREQAEEDDAAEQAEGEAVLSELVH
jgi:hypothetical protein